MQRLAANRLKLSKFIISVDSIAREAEILIRKMIIIILVTYTRWVVVHVVTIKRLQCNAISHNIRKK